MKSEVGQSKRDDLIASYSAKGPTLFGHVVKPDIAAPGNRVISDMTIVSYMSLTNPQNQVLNSSYSTSRQSPFNLVNSSLYFQMSGTSMAAPVGAAPRL